MVRTLNFVLHPLGNPGRVLNWEGTCSDWDRRYSHGTTDLWNAMNRRDLKITQSALLLILISPRTGRSP